MGTCSKDHKSAAGHVRITGVWHQAWLLTAIPQPKRWHVYQAGLHHLFGSEEVKHIYGCHVGRAQKSLENPNCPNIIILYSLFWAFMCHGRSVTRPSQPASRLHHPHGLHTESASESPSWTLCSVREVALVLVLTPSPPSPSPFPAGLLLCIAPAVPPLPFQLRRAGCRGTRAVCSPRPHAAIEFTLSGP